MANSILDKIAKLLALQESRGATEAEAELGYRVREYRSDAEAGQTRAHVATWARRSRERWPGRAVLMCTSDHCVVLRDGVVYDNWMPHGVPGEAHPFARSVVVWAALVEKV